MPITAPIVPDAMLDHRVVTPTGQRLYRGLDLDSANDTSYLSSFAERIQRDLYVNANHARNGLHPANLHDPDYASLSDEGVFSNPAATPDPNLYVLYFYQTPKPESPLPHGLAVQDVLGIGINYGQTRDDLEDPGRRCRLMLDLAHLRVTLDGEPFDNGATIDTPDGIVSVPTIIGKAFAADVNRRFRPTEPIEYLGHLPSGFLREVFTDDAVRQLQSVTGPGWGLDPVAYVFNRFAVIPYDFIHAPEDSPRAFNRIMDAIANIYLNGVHQEAPVEVPELTPEEAAEQARAATAARIENTLQSMKQWAERRAEVGVRAAVESTERKLTQINRLLQQLHAERLQMRELMLTVEAMRAMNNTSNVDLASFRRMMEVGVITGAAVSRTADNVLVFDTRPLAAFDDRTDAYHLIGRMRISVDMGNGRVTFTNRDRKVDGFNREMNAPHVYADGSACLGSFADTIPEFVSRGDWVGLVTASIQFIESANTSDPAGHYVFRWPFVENPEEYGLPPYDGEVTPYEQR